MSNSFLNIISGQASSTISTLPVGSSVKIGPQAVFGKVFNGIFSAFTGNLNNGGAGSQLLGGNAGINPQALQAYNNAQASGSIPQQLLQAQALAPGSSIIGGQAQPPSPLQNVLASNLAGSNPLQGGAGTTNFNPNGQQLPSGPIGFQGFGLPSGGGKLQMLIYPVLGLVSMFKSLFGIRKIMGGMQPIKVHKENLAYNQTDKNISQFEHEEGSFDEYIYPQEESQSGSSIQQLTDF